MVASKRQGAARGVRSRQQTPQMALEVGEQTGQGCHVVKHHWPVERTCAWGLNDRRHSRDYATLTGSSEAMIQMSMLRLLLTDGVSLFKTTQFHWSLIN
jgi:transposase